MFHETTEHWLVVVVNDYGVHERSIYAESQVEAEEKADRLFGENWLSVEPIVISDRNHF